MPRPLDKSHAYVAGLDGLRTIAVFAVIAFHLSVPGLDGGLLGVGVFFTLSGYLITTNLMRSWDQRGNLGLTTFWVRRFRRLVPAVVVMVISVLMLTAVFKPEKLAERSGEGLSTIFYVNNWHMIIKGESYFDQFGGLGPLSHTWSLSVEEQFYIFWPLVLLLLLKVFTSRFGAWISTLVLAAGSFMLLVVLATDTMNQNMDLTRVYEGTDTRAGGLLIGAALAIWYSAMREKDRETQLKPWAANLIGTAGMAIIIMLMMVGRKQAPMLYQYGFLALSIGTVMVIAAVVQQHSLWALVLGWAPMRWLGERSYGIYLWHVPLISFWPAEWLEHYRLASGLAISVLATLIAAMSWYLVEDPIRRYGLIAPWRQAHKQQEEGLSTARGPLSALLHKPVPANITPTTLTGAASSVVLLSLLTVGIPAVATSSGQVKQPAQTMALDNDPEAAISVTAEKPADNSAPQMYCSTVVHVGDSTSLGIFNESAVNDPAVDTGQHTYAEYGAKQVVPNAFGARATNMGWHDQNTGEYYTSGLEALDTLVPQYAADDTCWAIALGTNDAANLAAMGTRDEAPSHIDAMMAKLDSQKVMWVNTVSNTNYDAYANENMQVFNHYLVEATDRYDNLRIFDWASEARPEWFAEGDITHYNPEGNTQRAHRFAAALANAYPKQLEGKPSKEHVVSSGL